MRLHQVLTGAANVTEESVAVGYGSVSGYPFTVYGSGYEVVVLDSHFNRVQIISNDDQSITAIIKCIACSSNGKIAASFGSLVVIYQPLLTQSAVSSESKLPFTWKKVFVLATETEVRRLCWDHEGKRLLVGSDSLHIWRQEIHHSTSESGNSLKVADKWACVWHRKLSTPANLLEFSPDSHYFASAAQNDSMVKIWFRITKASSSSHFHHHHSTSVSEERYNFIYILHPKPVQSFSWRKISKHMPLSCVPNVLLTSCTDNICRIWAETVKYKASNHNIEKKTQHVHAEMKTDGNTKATDIHIPEERSHHQRYHLVGMLHFHLAAVINPSTDIALLSTIPTSSIFGRCFQLEWLNNKEVQFTTAVEAIYASLRNTTDHERSDDEMTNETDPFLLVDGIELEFQDAMNDSDKILNRTLEEDEADIDLDVNNKTQSNAGRLDVQNPESSDSPNQNEEEISHSLSQTYKNQLNNLLHDWCNSSDTLYCIHPVDGSLLIWVVDFLDDFNSAYYRQVQVSFASRIPATFSKADANSLCLTKTYHYTQPVHRAISHVPNMDSFFLKYAAKYTLMNNEGAAKSELSVLQVSYLVSVHADGSLNLWLITFSDSGSFMGIASLTHITRNCGPRFEITNLLCHPILPLTIGTSRRNQVFPSSITESHRVNTSFYRNINNIESELILWSTTNVSPLCKFKGVTEMARISSSQANEFQKMSWVPSLFHHSLISITNDGVEIIPDTTCSAFIAVSESGLYLYQVLLDIKNFLSNLSVQDPSKHHLLTDFIESEQSGSQSACIMKICNLSDSILLHNISFLKIFSANSLVDTNTSLTDKNEVFFVVATSFTPEKGTFVNIWELKITDNKRFCMGMSPQSPKSVYSDFSPVDKNLLNITHCVQQKLIVRELLITASEKPKYFSAAIDIPSSNFKPICPVSFNFLTVSHCNHIKFWKLVNELLPNEENSVSVVQIFDISSESSRLCKTGEIIGISSAHPGMFAYVNKVQENHSTKFHLHIEESISTGQFIWNEECNLPVYLRDYSSDSIVQLSWLSLENGSHVLALTLSNMVFIYHKTRLNNLNSFKESNCNVTWEILKTINHNNIEDSLCVTTISWSKCGFFMIGVENEIQVYSQWEDNKEIVFKKSTTHALPVDDETFEPEQSVILTKNSFTEVCESIHVLPQYHPDHLLQLLQLGKMRRVRAILKYLVKYVAGEKALENPANSSGRTRARTLTRTYSNLSEYGSLSSSPAEIKITEPVDSEQNIDVIPPLSMVFLLQADNDDTGSCNTQNNEDDKDEVEDHSKSLVHYGMLEANVLTENLTRKQLPGLTRQEQMYLLALSDTVASTSYDIEAISKSKQVSPSKTADVSLSTFNSGGGGYASTGGTTSSENFDDCGLHFLLMIRHHTALLKSLSQKHRAALQEKGMSPSEYCWAFHSDCTEELLSMIPCMAHNEPTWTELKAHGVGFWVKSNDILKRMVEKISKFQFQLKKDPLDCAIFYLAMKKQSLLCALYRSLRDTKMATFFSNDFTQERWRKAAMKNAYALLGKQRFEHAAAFFLLANSLWDAVQVCIDRLKDVQLALVISRFFENGFEPTHNNILRKFFIEAIEPEPYFKDPFLQSMTYWMLKDYNSSFKVLLLSVSSKTNEKVVYDYQAIFNYYHYLSKHPLLKRRHFTQYAMSPLERDNTKTWLKEISNEDDMFSQERKLVFRTAYTYMNAGLPDIAFEVLCMMPKEKSKDMTSEEMISPSPSGVWDKDDMIITGAIQNDFSSWNNQSSWNEFSPSSFTTNRFADLDSEYKIDIDISSESESEDSDKDEQAEEKERIPTEEKEESSFQNENQTSDESKEEDKFSQDSISLSMKFTCLVLCIIEELKALPYKCIKEKTRLRSSLNELLACELILLHDHCDLITSNESSLLPGETRSTRSLSRLSSNSFDVSIDDMSFSEKVEHVTLHAEWLKKNQRVLTSLYEHCSMVGTGETDLPAICLELLLLLHEIEDHRVLSTPMRSISAGPSAPPLLLASMSSFPLVASPSGYLNSMAQDILQTVIDLPSLPNPENPVTRLADLEKLMFSLSSCLYHGLCGGEDDKVLASIRKGEVELVGKQMKDGKLVRLPYGAADVDIEVTSPPANWPGVKFFLSILTANKKTGSHCIRLLLCETAVAIYLSMFVSAMSRLSCNNLYRFVMNGLSEDMWSSVFGGGTKIVVPAPDLMASNVSSGSSVPDKQESNQRDAARMKWNYRLLGNKNETAQKSVVDENQKLVRHELFLSPKMSLCEYFLSKPKSLSFEYDSDNEDESDSEDMFMNDVFEDSDTEIDDGLDDTIFQKQAAKRAERQKQNEKLNEHLDSKSYPWLIMRLALVKLASENISYFLNMAGLDVSELPTQSPLVYNATKILLRWEQLIHAQLDSFPDLDESLIDYTTVQQDGGFIRGGIVLQKIKALLDATNTPFSRLTSKSLPAKRLWFTLVQQESLRQIFVHYAFKSSQYGTTDETDFEDISGKVIHKDMDPVTSFSLNKSNMNHIAVSTIHEIIEYDISGSLSNDVFNMNELTSSDGTDNTDGSQKVSSPTVIQRRTCTGIRRMDSHPSLPYYITGGADGSVRMWEFIHPDQITMFRPAGQNERVNKIQFNPLGNKFAVVDDSGYLSMWLIANTHDTAPFWTYRCHSKSCLDFAFIGSSSMIATVGYSNDKRNVCIWDTLMPPKKYLIHSFSHNIHGAQSILYVPGQQTLITGGKRGDICIFDIRQRRLLHTFHAHDSVVKTMALNPSENFFVTGSIDGDIKVWDLMEHKLIESFPREHNRGSVSLRQVSPGVQRLYAFESEQLMSCGGDGTLKWRVLKMKR